MPGALTITGDDAVIADLDQAGLTVGLRASRVVVDVAGKVADTQRDTVRRRSGQTAESIAATTPGGMPLGPGALEAEIGPELPLGWRGHFIENGTQRHGPFPFVGTSVDPHLAELYARLGLVAVDI